MDSSRTIVFFAGRDNWEKDQELNQIIVKFLVENNIEIRWEDPAENLLFKFRFLEKHFNWLPPFLKRNRRKIVQLTYGIFNWSYLNYYFNFYYNNYSGKSNKTIDFRTKKLKESVLNLGNKKDIIVLARSSGGRFISSVADELKLKQIICLGYPFKHTKMPDEPSRYLHLRNLKTPMLIIQGEHDEYGGIESKDKYELSSKVKLEFINTDHDFNINIDTWNYVLNRIKDIIFLN